MVEGYTTSTRPKISVLTDCPGSNPVFPLNVQIGLLKIEDVVRRAGDSNQADSGLTLRGESEEWGKKQSHWKKSWRGRGWKSHRRLGIESVWVTCVRVQRQHACEEENVCAKMTDDGGQWKQDSEDDFPRTSRSL